MTEGRDWDWQIRTAVAADLELLAALHDREADEATLLALAEIGFPNGLALNVESTLEGYTPERIRLAVIHLAEACSPAMLDELAAGYAEVYLLHGLGASPTASPWLDEDGLQRQEPMLKIRRWFRKHHLVIADGAGRADDHIVYNLMFLAHLLRTVPGDAGLAEACAFLEQHPRRWIGAFARRIEARAGPPFYCAVAAVTAAYLDALAAALDIFRGEADGFQPPLPTLPSCGIPCGPDHPG